MYDSKSNWNNHIRNCLEYNVIWFVNGNKNFLVKDFYFLTHPHLIIYIYFVLFSKCYMVGGCFGAQRCENHLKKRIMQMIAITINTKASASFTAKGGNQQIARLEIRDSFKHLSF